MYLKFISGNGRPSFVQVFDAKQYRVEERETEISVYIELEKDRTVLQIISEDSNDWDRCYVMNENGKTIDTIFQ